jgi:ABC-type phosphate transport system substrate-binding protein
MNKLISKLIFLAVCSLTFAGDFVIIANPANSAANISAAELKRIYTGKMSNFGGQKAVPIILADTDPLHSDFVSKITKMNPSEYKQFWVEAQIKGEGSAPMMQRNSAAAKIIVSTIPGAIAYVDASVVDGSVKKIDLK